MLYVINNLSHHVIIILFKLCTGDLPHCHFLEEKVCCNPNIVAIVKHHVVTEL